MTRSKHDIELLRELGYDPDDPTYTVENFDTEEEPVTATETYPELLTIEEGITELKIALQAAIEALQKVRDLIK